MPLNLRVREWSSVTQARVTLLDPCHSHATLHREGGKNEGGRKEEEEPAAAAGGGEGEVTRHAGGSQNSSGHDGGGDSFIPFPRQHGRSVASRSDGSGLRGLFPFPLLPIASKSQAPHTSPRPPYHTLTDNSLTWANKAKRDTHKPHTRHR